MHLFGESGLERILLWFGQTFEAPAKPRTECVPLVHVTPTLLLGLNRREQPFALSAAKRHHCCAGPG